MWKRGPIKAYWWNAKPNFGDAIAPLLLARFAGLRVTRGTIAESSIVTVGSVLEHVPPEWPGIILGAGKLREEARLTITAPTIVLGMRGPLSAKGRDVTIGDPGLLADELVGSQSRTYDLGIVPHWTDKTLVRDPRFHNPNWSTTVIDPSGDPLDVIAHIGQCKKIITSSLHGMIVADAFGIPRRFEYTKRFDHEGGTFKFRDYSASIDAPLVVGKTYRANVHVVEDRKCEMHDAYARLKTLVRRNDVF